MCARLAGRRLISVHSPAAFLRAQVQYPGVGIVCWPNNPTGDLWPLEFLTDPVSAGPLVVDLAYSPLCDSSQADGIGAASAKVYRLWRLRLVRSLTQLGIPVRGSPATVLLAKAGDAARTPDAQRALLPALKSAL